MKHFKRSAVLLLVALAVTAPVEAQGWRPDVSKAAIPRRAAAGMVAGQKFVVQQAELTGGEDTFNGKKNDRRSYFLRLRQGRDFFADREFMVFIAARTGDVPDGRSYAVMPGDTFKQANPVVAGGMTYPPIQGVHMSYKVSGETLPKTEMGDKYSMRLVFGRRKGNRLPGSVYITMHDKHRSYVAGTFTAMVKK